MKSYLGSNRRASVSSLSASVDHFHVVEDGLFTLDADLVVESRDEGFDPRVQLVGTHGRLPGLRFQTRGAINGARGSGGRPLGSLEDDAPVIVL